MARPQDRVVNGSELCCEISGEATQATETVPQLGRMRAAASRSIDVFNYIGTYNMQNTCMCIVEYP